MRIRSTEHAVLLHDVDAPATERSFRGDVSFPPPQAPLGTYAVAAFDLKNPVARLARSLRLSISAFPLPDEPVIRSVAVLGIGAGLESSVLSANLAITYAQGGTPTVLIDVNPGEPVQHLMFGLSKGDGLMEAVTKGSDARNHVHASGVRNLAVLLGGATEEGNQALLDGQHFHRSAMPLLETYSMMVVDAGSPFGEPQALCEALDAAVLVARRNVTALEDVRNMVARLEEMKVRVIGTVMVE